jgi:hypothetical protein
MSEEGGAVRAKDYVLDAVDVETFLVCDDEEHGRRLALALMAEMGFKSADVVFIEWRGLGARVRVRAYVHRPGEQYPWLAAGGDRHGG